VAYFLDLPVFSLQSVSNVRYVQRWLTHRLVTWRWEQIWRTASSRKEWIVCSNASRNAQPLDSEFQPP